MRCVVLALTLGASLNLASAQEVVTVKMAVVALAAQPGLRAEFEEGLVAKALENNYDAVTSYNLVPDVTDVDDADFIERVRNLIVVNINGIRPAIREYLGLPLL